MFCGASIVGIDRLKKTVKKCDVAFAIPLSWLHCIMHIVVLTLVETCRGLPRPFARRPMKGKLIALDTDVRIEEQW